jgi:general stress protein YciG
MPRTKKMSGTRGARGRAKARRSGGGATVREAGRKGGRRTLERRGPEFFSRIGRKGGKSSGGSRRASAGKGRTGRGRGPGRKPTRRG